MSRATFTTVTLEEPDVQLLLLGLAIVAIADHDWHQQLTKLAKRVGGSTLAFENYKTLVREDATVSDIVRQIQTGVPMKAGA